MLIFYIIGYIIATFIGYNHFSNEAPSDDYIMENVVFSLLIGLMSWLVVVVSFIIILIKNYRLKNSR